MSFYRLMNRLCRLVLFVIFAVGITPTATASEEAGEPVDLFQKFDQNFETYIVNNIAAVLFFDLMFYDDYRLMGDGVGEEIESEEHGLEQITDFKSGNYVFQSIYDIDRSSLVPRLTDPIEKKLGQIDFSISSMKGALYGKPLKAQLDLEALGLAEQLKEVDEANPIRVITGIAPVGIVVDTRHGMVVGVSSRQFPADAELAMHPITDEAEVNKKVKLSNEVIELTAGMSVINGDEEATVRSVNDGIYTVLSSTRRTSEKPLANPDAVSLPFVVIWLVIGALFFTFRMGFINLRGFKHAIEVTTGKYDDPSDPGEISHFQALASALSATVGLGNIAGVAIAISIGGPGAVIWMVIAAFFGMSSKFVECTLGQMYRTVRPDGTVSGGPMHYLDKGIEGLELGVFGSVLGKGLAILFALMCIGGSLGGGNMFQASQSYLAVAEVLPSMEPWMYGILLATLVAVVIIGGIKRIGAATSIIVPAMCGLYVIAGLWILAVNAADVPGAFGTMLDGAFNAQGVQGGVIGVLIQGFQRASFSNEAGVGSASIAHSAAATHEPVREGLVALLEPFIDTILVCTMTGLVVVVTGVYKTGGSDGVVMTSRAFETVFPWFPVVLSIAVVLFAFSTMIAWSYYGERCITWLLGEWAAYPYRLVFVICVFFGCIFNPGSVLDFSDLMVLGMALPNIFGAIMLSGKVKARLDDYMSDLNKGIFDLQKENSP